MDEKKAKNEIVRYMKSLGIYKKEYTRAVVILAKMLTDLDTAEQKFIDSGGEFVVEHTNKNGSTNLEKNPYYQVIENLRRDSINVMRELGITPQGLKRFNDKLTATEKKTESSLEKVLKMYGT